MKAQILIKKVFVGRNWYLKKISKCGASTFRNSKNTEIMIFKCRGLVYQLFIGVSTDFISRKGVFLSIFFRTDVIFHKTCLKNCQKSGFSAKKWPKIDQKITIFGSKTRFSQNYDYSFCKNNFRFEKYRL